MFKRVIKEVLHEQDEISFTVTSNSTENLANFVELLATIQYLSSVGSSRTIRLAVDGDGASDLRFFTDDGERIETGHISTEKEEISIGIGH